MFIQGQEIHSVFVGTYFFEPFAYVNKCEDPWLKWFGKWSLSGLEFWNDSMLRPGCNVHYIVLLTPRSQWDSEAKTRAGWCTDTTRLWREARGFCSTTHFWWQKNHQQFEQLWNVLWNFEFFRPRCFPARPVRQCFNTWSLITPDAKRQLQSSQRAWSLNGESSQKKNLLKRTVNPVMRMGKPPKKPTSSFSLEQEDNGKTILSCEESPVMVHFA